MSISYGGDSWVMSTPYASQVAAGVKALGVIIGGIDEDGNEAEPSQEVLDAYDQSIRNGDLAFVEWMLQTYGHYNVPILDEDPISMLEHANESALFMLDDMEYIVLPDIVRMIVYDDPIFLWSRPIDDDLMRQIFRADAFAVYSAYREDIFKLLRQMCLKGGSKCEKYMALIHGSILQDLKASASKFNTKHINLSIDAPQP